MEFDFLVKKDQRSSKHYLISIILYNPFSWLLASWVETWYLESLVGMKSWYLQVQISTDVAQYWFIFKNLVVEVWYCSYVTWLIYYKEEIGQLNCSFKGYKISIFLKICEKMKLHKTTQICIICFLHRQQCSVEWRLGTTGKH